LAAVRGTRWTVEEDIQSGKGECGLDEYETRGWVGWHHHTALSMLALAFLVLQRQRMGEKRGGRSRWACRGGAPWCITCWRCACGTAPRSSGGPAGAGNATAGQPPATASGAPPTCAGGCGVERDPLRCGTR